MESSGKLGSHLSDEQGLRFLDRRRFVYGLAAAALAGKRLYGQESKPVTTLSVDVKLVNVYATVRDKKGAIIQNLSKEDFSIQEDGRPQTIRFFSRESDLPLTLGLLVDTSPSEYEMIDQEREASRDFFSKVLQPKKDKAFVIHFDREVELLQDLTLSRPKLDEALDKLKGLDDGGGGPGNGPRGQNFQQATGDQDQSQDQDQGRSEEHGPPRGGGGTTHLFDAVYLASHDVLKTQSGRKAIVVIGDGDDMGSKYTKAEAIREAQKADVIIYCVRIVDKNFGKGGGHGSGFHLPIGIPGGPGMGGPGGGGGEGPYGSGSGGPGGSPGGGPGGGPGGSPDRNEGRKNMAALAVETGGTLFETSKKLTLDEIFSKIQEELRSQYSLGYTPQADAREGYRRIQITTNKKSLLRCRTPCRW
jgi:VWFA-related protein